MIFFLHRIRGEGRLKSGLQIPVLNINLCEGGVKGYKEFKKLLKHWGVDFIIERRRKTMGEKDISGLGEIDVVIGSDMWYDIL